MLPPESRKHFFFKWDAFIFMHFVTYVCVWARNVYKLSYKTANLHVYIVRFDSNFAKLFKHLNPLIEWFR